MLKFVSLSLAPQSLSLSLSPAGRVSPSWKLLVGLCRGDSGRVGEGGVVVELLLLLLTGAAGGGGDSGAAAVGPLLAPVAPPPTISSPIRITESPPPDMAAGVLVPPSWFC